jgi:hypothetical protein
MGGVRGLRRWEKPAFWEDMVRRVAIVFGWILLVIAGGLILLVISSWPPGGLMFALPFVFLMPGLLFALIGGALLWWGRRPAKVCPTEPDK